MNLSIRLPKNQEDRNYWHLVVEIAWFGLGCPALTRFLSVYAIHLGADDTLLNAMVWLPSFILIFTASLGARWMSRFSDPRAAIVLPSIGYRLSFLMPALTPFMPPSFQLPWLLLSVVLPAIPNGIASVTFFVLLREGVSEKHIAGLLGWRMFFFNATLGASGYLTGLWLEHAPYPINYQIMFAVAFVFALLSLWHVSKVRGLPHLTAKPILEKARQVNPWKDGAFQRVAFLTGSAHLAMFTAHALIPLHLIRDLDASESFMGQFGLAELVAGALAAVCAKWISQHIGNRSMVGLGMVGAGASLFLTATATHLNLTLLAGAIGGASWMLASIGQVSYFSERTPLENKTDYTKAFNQVIFTAMFVGPLVGQLMSSLNVPLVIILLIGASLRVTAGIVTQIPARQWVTRRLAPVLR